MYTRHVLHVYKSVLFIISPMSMQKYEKQNLFKKKMITIKLKSVTILI